MSVGPRAPNTCSSQDTQDLWGAAMNVTGQMTEPHKGWKNVHWWRCQTPGGAGAGPAGVKRTRKGWSLAVAPGVHLPPARGGKSPHQASWQSKSPAQQYRCLFPKSGVKRPVPASPAQVRAQDPPPPSLPHIPIRGDDDRTPRSRSHDHSGS